MAGEATLAALMEILPQVQQMPVWATIEPELRSFIERYHTSDDTEKQAWIARKIRKMLRQQAPEVYQLLLAAIQKREQEHKAVTRDVPPPPLRGDSITMGDVSNATGVAVGPHAQATVHQHYHEPRYTRYTDISCPRRVHITERFTITVALTLQQRTESVVQQAVEVYEGKVRVRLAAPDFELLSSQEQTMVIEPDEDSAPIVFHLKPRTQGRHEISIQFWQRGNLIATAIVPIEALATQPAFEAAIIPSVAINPWMAGVRSPDLTLAVTRDPSGCMEFTLSGDGVVLFSSEHTLSCDPRAFIDQLYDEIGLLQRGQDSINGQRTGRRLLDADQVERRIRNLGYLLWDRLIPADLKQFYGRERARWRVTGANDRRWSLLVQSNEADIPWELVRPYSEGADHWEEDFWCHTFYFARWLLRRPDVLACFAPLPQLRLGALAAIVPACYPELQAAPVEHALLRDLMARHHLQDRSPPRATEPALIALLEQGGYDWMHMITHGDFFAESALHSSAIGQEDRQGLACSAITGPRIRGMLHDQRPAFILNACHVGRAAPSISGAAGWATQLIGSGAGMLVAPLWSVSDQRAAQFSQVFYEALLHAEQTASVAEAMWHARAAIRDDSDPTWLAYSLYAHPNARVYCNGAGRRQTP
jgi:hypothetical protein